MRLGLLSLLLALILYGSEPLRPGSQFPPLEGTALSGRKVRLPEASLGKPSVLIIGFTKEAGPPSMEWARRFLRDPGLPHVPVFQIPIIEHAPRLLRPLISSGLRREVEKPLHDFAVLCYRDEKTWKQRAGFSRHDASYLFVLDAQGKILAHTAGQYTEHGYQMLRSALLTETVSMNR